MTRRNYTDHEIACYVLGLETSIPAQDIEQALAHDNAAAARALKWETYFLCIVDTLPQQAPSTTLLTHIEQSLGVALSPQEPDTSRQADTSRPQTEPPLAEPADLDDSAPAAPGVPPGPRPWWRRWPALCAAAAIAVAGLLLLWGLTRDIAPTEVSQTLEQTAAQTPSARP